MNPNTAKAIFLAATAAMAVVRAPHVRRSVAVKVVRNRKGTLETTLLVIASLGFVLPLTWIATSVLAFAEYPLRPVPLVVGVAAFSLGIWLLHRSHVDLGTNWSNTLEVREGHLLVDGGVYRHVRHPMYGALLLYAVGQALVIPNWVAGPSLLVVFALLFALRMGPEERMMRDEFGAAYDAYAARTKRLVPGIW